MNPALQRNLQQSDLRVFIELEHDASNRITRMAAVLYDVENSKEVAAFDRVVRADDSQDFADALANLASFCAGQAVWTYDGAQRFLKENCGRYALQFPFQRPFIRVRSLLRGWGVKPSGYVAGDLHKAAGLKSDGTMGALHDARSVAGAVSFFENLGLL